LLPVGTLLALVGAVALAGRDRAAALLLLTSYAVVLIFCSAYYVIDVDAFLLPAHLIAALLLGEGAMLLLRRLPRRLDNAAGYLLLLLPLLLLGRNLGSIRAANSAAPEQAARSIMAQPLDTPALIVDERNSIERLRYLQDIEGQQPEVALRSNQDRAAILAALADGQTVYLLEPAPALGLSQWPEGQLWQVGAQPLTTAQVPASSLRWANGIKLIGFTLPPGPYHPGETVPLTLEWEAESNPPQIYILFVHLVGPQGTLWGQQDRAPLPVPTNQWLPGDHYVDLYGPQLHPDAPPGRYDVVLGWYHHQTLERLLVRSNGTTTEAIDTLTLGTIEVVAGDG
jgi:hypothetical protein